jgi:hypothetical protein
MLRYDVPQRDEGYSLWIELSSFEELPLEHRRTTKHTLAQLMTKGPILEIGGIKPHLIPYADLLTAFPDLDPESTYVISHFKLDRPYKWPPLK